MGLPIEAKGLETKRNALESWLTCLILFCSICRHNGPCSSTSWHDQTNVVPVCIQCLCMMEISRRLLAKCPNMTAIQTFSLLLSSFFFECGGVRHDLELSIMTHFRLGFKHGDGSSARHCRGNDLSRTSIILHFPLGSCTIWKIHLTLRPLARLHLYVSLSDIIMLHSHTSLILMNVGFCFPLRIALLSCRFSHVFSLSSAFASTSCFATYLLRFCGRSCSRLIHYDLTKSANMCLPDLIVSPAAV